MSDRYLGLIPARGGSRGIPHKNIAPLAGRPLLSWTAEASLRSRLDRVVLSSDDAEIARVARDSGVEVPFVRPAELATDDALAIDVVLHAVRWLAEHDDFRPEAVVLLQPTSPLRTAAHIDEAIALFERAGADSLVSVVSVPHSMGPESIMVMGADGTVTPYGEEHGRGSLRQLKPRYYARNGAAIYIVRTAVLLESESLYGDRTIAYEMSREDSVDVDEAFDLELCGWILSRRVAREAASSS